VSSISWQRWTIFTPKIRVVGIDDKVNGTIVFKNIFLISRNQ
jgi:hypothetical protein